MTVTESIDALLEHFSSERFSDEVNMARREFNELTGGPFDQSADDFEMKMSQFADWYLFERVHSELAAIPVQSEVAKDLASKQGFEPQLEQLIESRSSLFEFLKVKGEDVFIKDLVANEKIVVPGSQMTVGFQRDEYFQARLVKKEEAFQFGPAFCFHPAPAGRYLMKEVKRIRKVKDVAEKENEKSSLLLKVFKMKYKLNQYKHVDVKDIYSADPKLRF
ncbi:MAG: hypothetical protein AAF202_00305 [Pseudomonadota bacterium]